MKHPQILAAQRVTLRRALRTAVKLLRGTDAAHIVVELGRDNQGLSRYLNRILKDTK